MRKQIGVVPQKAVAVSGTIKSNLQMGNEQASETGDVCSIKNRTGLEFVEEKPGRLNAPVSEGEKTCREGRDEADDRKSTGEKSTDN